MQQQDELPRISDDDDWMELRDGQQAILSGRLYGALQHAQDSLIVSNTSWEVIAVMLPGGHAGEPLPAGTSVTIMVTRCEDGIETTTADIQVHQE